MANCTHDRKAMLKINSLKHKYPQTGFCCFLPKYSDWKKGWWVWVLPVSQVLVAACCLRFLSYAILEGVSIGKQACPWPAPDLETWESLHLWLSINAKVLLRATLYFSSSSRLTFQRPCKSPPLCPPHCHFSSVSVAAVILCLSSVNFMRDICCVVWLSGTPWLQTAKMLEKPFQLCFKCYCKVSQVRKACVGLLQNGNVWMLWLLFWNM